MKAIVGLLTMVFAAANVGDADVVTLDNFVDGLEAPSQGDETTPLAACQNVTINVKNGKSRKIKALKIDYQSIEDGKTRTESFSNVEVNSGATKTVASGQSLQHIEGHRMKSIKLYYKAECGGRWSDTFTTTDTSFADATCVYGKTYRIDVPGGDPC